ncbi:MAG: hypothetical protein ACE5PV_15210 [Candidatus Poribacteria bacterium]
MAIVLPPIVEVSVHDFPVAFQYIRIYQNKSGQDRIVSISNQDDPLASGAKVFLLPYSYAGADTIGLLVDTYDTTTLMVPAGGELWAAATVVDTGVSVCVHEMQ